MMSFDSGKRRAAITLDKFILTFVLALRISDAHSHKKVMVQKLGQKEEFPKTRKKEATKPKALFDSNVELSRNCLDIRNPQLLFYFICCFWFL
jgi:hypothetical protein